MKLKITAVAKKLGGGEFCFVDYTEFSSNPEDLCVDWSELGDRLYEPKDGKPYGQLSKPFYANAAALFAEVILPYYSENCIKLPEATWPRTPDGGGVYQGKFDLNMEDYYTDCPELSTYYASKTEL